MFFFIGGVQPKTVELNEKPSMCRSCGLYQAKLKRIDHYISVFFIPVLRIKKGVPFLVCDKCGGGSGEYGLNTCPNCGKPLESDFQYCPFCGKRL